MTTERCSRNNTRAALDALQIELRDIHYAAERRCRQDADVLGRLDAALADVQDTFDEYPSDVLAAGQVEFLREAYEEIAALALTELARLRVHPQFGKGEFCLEEGED